MFYEKDAKNFLEKDRIFKLDLLYFKTISRGWNFSEKSENVLQKKSSKKTKFSNLIYSISKPFLEDGISEKKGKCSVKKNSSKKT